MTAAYVCLAVAITSCLCLIASGANSQPKPASAYSKLTHVAIRTAKRLCHNKDSKVCLEFKKAVAVYQSKLLSMYTDEGITGAAIKSTEDKDKQKDGSTTGDNKQNTGTDNSGTKNTGTNNSGTKNTGTNSSGTKNTGTDSSGQGNNNDNSGKAGYFGNPGISLGK